MSRTYWRSLAEFEDRPEVRAALEREFLEEGPSEHPDGISRRDMIMLLGASLSLAGATGCIRRPVEEIVPYVTAPEDAVPGIPRYYATTMPFGRSAYGLIVESHEGRPTKIEGNPAHPATLGASSSRIQASVLGLYDPDRSQSLRLKGEPKSWTDFVTAWGELAKAHIADNGAGLAVLSESFSSLTLARLAAELHALYPKIQWVTYDAVSDENRLSGLKQATGRDVDLTLRFDRATVILCLDADPLLTDPEAIRHARGFADGRRAGASPSTGSGQATMNRLYAVEGVFSLTGAMADHRLRLQSRQIAPFLAALAGRLGAPGASAGSAVPGVDPRWIDALAKDLLANRGKGLIVAGERQPAAVHAAVCALNTHLGNTGQTVTYYEIKDAALPSVSSLGSLVGAMNAGTIKTLVVLGGNPVFDAPADLDFAAAMAKVAAHDRARPHGRRNIIPGGVAYSPRALSRIVGRCARGRRHAQRRPAPDPPAVRRTIRGGSAGPDGRGPGSSGLRPRAGHVETGAGRGRVREEVEPRAARRIAGRQRAPGSHSRSKRRRVRQPSRRRRFE